MTTQGALRWRWSRPSAWLVDGLLAAAVFATGVLSTGGATNGDVAYTPRDGWAFLLIAVASAAMLFRSRAPMTVLVVSCVAVVILSANNYSEGALPAWLLVPAATVGARYPVRRVVAAGVFVAALLCLLLALENDRGFGPSTFAIQLALFSTAFTVGINLRSRAQRTEALQQRADALEETREEEAKRAVADERLRIAQELHDVLAHTLSVIAVQAGTGAHVIGSDPDEARRALENIATTSRASLAELRQLLGVLRTGADDTAYVPAPRLADLDRLANDVSAAGVPVDVVVDGSPNGVTPGVELVAYRIVQEALTNVLKHAGPAHAHVHLGYQPGCLDIEVTDDGRGLASTGRSGHGLVGMRERVAMYGGTLQTGPAGGGGFRVVARLPYGEHATEPS
jgi:signal transduction histidine kinase